MKYHLQTYQKAFKINVFRSQNFRQFDDFNPFVSEEDVKFVLNLILIGSVLPILKKARCITNQAQVTLEPNVYNSPNVSSQPDITDYTSAIT